MAAEAEAAAVSLLPTPLRMPPQGMLPPAVLASTEPEMPPPELPTQRRCLPPPPLPMPPPPPPPLSPANTSPADTSANRVHGRLLVSSGSVNLELKVGGTVASSEPSAAGDTSSTPITQSSMQVAHTDLSIEGTRVSVEGDFGLVFRVTSKRVMVAYDTKQWYGLKRSDFESGDVKPEVHTDAEKAVRGVILKDSYIEEEQKTFILPSGYLYSLSTFGEWEHFTKYSPAPEGKQFSAAPVGFDLDIGDPVGLQVSAPLLFLGGGKGGKAAFNIDGSTLLLFGGIVRCKSNTDPVWAIVSGPTLSRHFFATTLSSIVGPRSRAVLPTAELFSDSFTYLADLLAVVARDIAGNYDITSFQRAFQHLAFKVTPHIGSNTPASSSTNVSVEAHGASAGGMLSVVSTTSTPPPKSFPDDKPLILATNLKGIGETKLLSFDEKELRRTALKMIDEKPQLIEQGSLSYNTYFQGLDLFTPLEPGRPKLKLARALHKGANKKFDHKHGALSKGWVSSEDDDGERSLTSGTKLNQLHNKSCALRPLNVSCAAIQIIGARHATRRRREQQPTSLTPNLTLPVARHRHCPQKTRCNCCKRSCVLQTKSERPT